MNLHIFWTHVKSNMFNQKRVNMLCFIEIETPYKHEETAHSIVVIYASEISLASELAVIANSETGEQKLICQKTSISLLFHLITSVSYTKFINGYQFKNV